MEIRFSEKYVGWPALKPSSLAIGVANTARRFDAAYALSSARGSMVRFTLPGASVDDHDRVIRALLTLDPDATIRTARAVFEGLKDFEAQYAARVK